MPTNSPPRSRRGWQYERRNNIHELQAQMDAAGGDPCCAVVSIATERGVGDNAGFIIISSAAGGVDITCEGTTSDAIEFEMEGE